MTEQTLVKSMCDIALQSTARLSDFVLRNTPQQFADEVGEKFAVAMRGVYELVRQAQHLESLATMPYAEYLATPEWQARAAEVKLLRGNRCEKCGSRDNLHAHHLTYENRGHEPLSDLQVLCKDCHAQEHSRAARAV